uniref:sensor histidine kinase n=1 Tax=Stappia sp. TaxID=1870903 RepID=UPI003BA9BB3C
MKFRIGRERAGRIDMKPDHPREGTALRGFLESLVHPQVAGDAGARRLHRRFILRHLALGGLALALLPLTLAFNGATTPAVTLAFAWLTAHLPVAMYVSRTGALERAQTVSATLFALFIAGLAVMTGGLASPALPFLALVPLEAVLSRSRRALIALLGISVALVAGLAGLTLTGSLPADVGFADTGLTLHAIALVAALVYATLLAARVLEAFSEDRGRVEAAEARTSLVARLGGEAVAVLRAGGRVESLSPEALPGLEGVGAADLVGDGLFERLHVGDRPAYLKAVSDALAGARCERLDLRLRTGGTRPGEAGRAAYAWACLAVAPHPARADMLVATLAGIDARKAQETARAEAESTAAEALAARSRFLATVNHELRTPLNAILGFSDLMRGLPERSLDARRVGDYATLIHQSGRHLLTLVDDMLDMARLEGGAMSIAPEAFDLRTCLESCRRMMEPEAARLGVTLTADLPLGIGEISADPRACRQIALNLMSNALKFTPSGGRAVVFARKEGSGVVFGVHDTGIGIADCDRERILLPFVRLPVDPPREGAGIGLSVVKGLAELHGGRVEIESWPGEGACVSVRLPRRAMAARDAGQAGAGATAEPIREPGPAAKLAEVAATVAEDARAAGLAARPFARKPEATRAPARLSA